MQCPRHYLCADFDSPPTNRIAQITKAAFLQYMLDSESIAVIALNLARPDTWTERKQHLPSFIIRSFQQLRLIVFH
jgi:hypothetical protein